MRRRARFISLASLLLSWICGGIASAQSPPGTDIHRIPILHGEDGEIRLGAPQAVTTRSGYDNQPFFHPDGRRLFYTAIVGASADSAENAPGQAEIRVHDLETGADEAVTDTPESEYSPTPIPGENALSVVRVEADGKQRLWRVPLGEGEPSLVLSAIEPVGYHAWDGDGRLALFVLGEPPTLQRAVPGDGQGEVLARDIGRSLHRVPGTHRISFSTKGEETWIRRVDLETGAMEDVVILPSGREDYAWGPDGALWSAEGSTLFRYRPGRDTEWRAVADLGEHGLRGLSRLAVHPDGGMLAVVAEETVGER